MDLGPADCANAGNDEHRRRRTPRLIVNHWPAKYTRSENLLAGWNECVILDLSLLGIGIEVPELTPEVQIGDHFSVEVDVGEDSSISLRLSGMVKNVRLGNGGTTRIGIEFVGLSGQEKSVLRAMEELDIRW